ncbi:MAG: FAD-binding oxidoreductase [bacterium]|nr:FAD-binding oxidoreductase [bacterium]
MHAPLSHLASDPSALSRDRLQRVAGWGGASSAMSWVYRPTTLEGVHAALAAARAHGLSVGLRGAGQSYGDASLNGENVTLDLSRMTRILDWNPDTGVARVEPGVTIRQLWEYAVEDGWWPMVVPGTMFVSLGGAVGANVHGKNAWKVGPIGDHVHAVDLLLPSGEQRTLTRDADPELFRATIGSFGLLGVVTSVTLSLKRVYSGQVLVEAATAPHLDALVDAFEARAPEADYLVGWVDLFARAPALGRSVIHQASYLAPGDDLRPARTLRRESQELPPTLFGVVPKTVLGPLMRPLLNDLGARLVNTAKYRLSVAQGTHRFLQPHAAFHFLFDYIPQWKRAYGPGGLIEWQCFLPAAATRATLREIVERMQRAGVLPYLGVFKKHRPDAFLVSHGVDGYSLACHFKVTASRRPALWRLCRELNRVVIEAGGRFYLAKDSTLEPGDLERSLGAGSVARLLALKRTCDPETLLQTELFRRLFPDALPVAPSRA